jgi:hypothetical protein
MKGVFAISEIVHENSRLPRHAALRVLAKNGCFGMPRYCKLKNGIEIAWRVFTRRAGTEIHADEWDAFRARGPLPGRMPRVLQTKLRSVSSFDDRRSPGIFFRAYPGYRARVHWRAGPMQEVRRNAHGRASSAPNHKPEVVTYGS